MFKWIFKVIKENIENLPQTYRLAKIELRKTYMSSDLGIFWAIMKPVMYLLMFYVAISVGFRAGKDIEGTVCPYFIWLAAGIVQWQFIQDLLVGGASCYNKRRNIVRNSKITLSTIPMISILSKFFIYVFMIFILMITAVLLGVRPSVYWLQLPIYMVLTVIFLYVWVTMTAMMNIISADILEFIKTIRTALFWLSGILFNIKGKNSPFFTYNPISYLAEGFRNAFAYHIWIWEEKRLFLHFAIVMLVMTFITSLLFRRMEKRLPEIL